MKVTKSITFPITPPTSGEDRWFIARRIGPGDNDFAGVGTAEGFWRTLMEARIAAKRLMEDGAVVDRIIRSTARGRQYFLPSDAPCSIPARADTRRYYLAARGQYGGWAPTMESTETGVGHLTSDFQANRKARRLREQGLRVDAVLLVNKDGATPLDPLTMQYDPTLDESSSPTDSKLKEAFAMIDDAMSGPTDAYPDGGSW